VNNNFFFLGGNILGMLACYSIELSARRDFFQAQLLQREREKVDASNRELEKQVNKRTWELVEAIEGLRKEIADRERAEAQLKRVRRNTEPSLKPSRRLTMRWTWPGASRFSMRLRSGFSGTPRKNCSA